MAESVQWILGTILIASALGMIFLRQPVHACLSFLVTLMALACFYLEYLAQFIAIIQILVYAGSILVIFMFVIILFQDAHAGIVRGKISLFIICSALALLSVFAILGERLKSIVVPNQIIISKEYGTVQSIGEKLYLEFFFPFEALILLFLVALIGSVYIAKRAVKE